MFTLVYCMEERKPKHTAWVTISQAGVAGPTVEKSAMSAPSSRVLMSRVRR